MKIRIKTVIAVFFLLFIALPSAASDADAVKLSLEAAVNLALEKNETLRSERQKVLAAEEIVKSTVAGFLPQIKASIDWKRYYEKPVMEFDMSEMGAMFAPLFGALGQPAPDIGIMQISPVKEFEASFGLTLTQPIFLGGKMALGIYLSSLAEKTQRTAYKNFENEIRYYTKVSYMNALLSRDVYELTRSSYNKALKNRDVVRKGGVSGRMSRMENIRMEADIAMKKPRMLEARMNHETALRNLSRLTGIDIEAKIELTGRMPEEFPEYDKNLLRQKLRENNLMIKIMKNTVALYDSLLTLERTKYLPDIYGFASYQYAGGNGSNMFIGAENVNRTVLVGIKAEYGLFTSGKRLFDNSRAERELAGKKIELEKTANDLEFELEKALHEYSRLKETYRELIYSEKLVKEAYSAVHEMFEAGLVTINDLNDAENNHDEMVKGKKRALFGINEVLARIDKLTAGGDGK
ncbi:MAG TPA: TolC family protein [bacterium]|nr:TolC family protein [bacterium]